MNEKDYNGNKELYIPRYNDQDFGGDYGETHILSGMLKNLVPLMGKKKRRDDSQYYLNEIAGRIFENHGVSLRGKCNAATGEVEYSCVDEEFSEFGRCTTMPELLRCMRASCSAVSGEQFNLNPMDIYDVVARTGACRIRLRLKNRRRSENLVFTFAVPDSIFESDIYIYAYKEKFAYDFVDPTEQLVRKEIEDYKRSASMIHEIKNALHVISGNYNLLSIADSDQERLDRILKMNGAYLYLAELVNGYEKEFLNAQYKDSIRFITLDDYARELTTMAEGLCQGRNISFSCVCTNDSEYETFAIEGATLSGIILNLISNSVKYAYVGGSVSLNLHLVKADVYKVTLVVIISDNGRGMTEETLKRAFDFGYREDSEDKEIRGYGIGLSVVNQSINNMGGTISATSKPGQGTTITFSVTLPAGDLSNRTDIYTEMGLAKLKFEILFPILANQKENSNAVTSAPLAPVDSSRVADETTSEAMAPRIPAFHRILLADDEDANMDLLKTMLTKMGIKYEDAYEGQEALDIFMDSEEGTFDAVIIDYNMEDMLGTEVIQHIRNTDRSDAGLVAFLVTGESRPEVLQSCLDAGFDRILLKPFDFAQLKEALDEMALASVKS